MIKIIITIIITHLFLFSNGQVQNHADVNSIIDSKKEYVISATDSIPKNTFKDPLFFIEGQLCQHLRKIFQDSKGNIWFGTNVYGVMLYDGKTLQYFDEKDGFIGGRITAILEDKVGNIWFGTASGLSKYDGQSFSHFTMEKEVWNNEVWSVMIDKQDKIWVGTTESVYIFDGTNFQDFELPKPTIKTSNYIYSQDRIVSILEDENGHIWFGRSGYGICKYDGQSFTHFTIKNGLADNVIYEMMFDKKGNLWIGTFFGGVSQYDGETFTNFTKDGIVDGEEVSGFFEDANGDIWFAAENHGVYRYRNNEFTNYYKESNLPTNGILSIYKDIQNRFWFGGWGGLFRFENENFISITKVDFK